MNRRDAFKVLGAGGLEVLGLGRQGTSATELPVVVTGFDPWRDVKDAPWPLMEEGEVYCLNCDEFRLRPDRGSFGHVATRFINRYELLHTDVYLDGEKQSNVYEALDSEWVIRTWGDKPKSHILYEGCNRETYIKDGPAPILVEFVTGPFEVRREDGFDPRLAGWEV